MGIYFKEVPIWSNCLKIVFLRWFFVLDQSEGVKFFLHVFELDRCPFFAILVVIFTQEIIGVVDSEFGSFFTCYFFEEFSKVVERNILRSLQAIEKL
jgi:hypothetical protein